VTETSPNPPNNVVSARPNRQDWIALNAHDFTRASHHVVYAARGKNGVPTLIVRDLRTGKKVIERDGFALDLDN